MRIAGVRVHGFLGAYLSATLRKSQKSSAGHGLSPEQVAAYRRKSVLGHRNLYITNHHQSRKKNLAYH